MRQYLSISCTTALMIAAAAAFAFPHSASAQDDKNPLVIAHRGASAYLPEHTLEAKVLAYAQGADYIEQDVVLTKDGVPVILHDIHLDTVTDVAEKFPDRAREDGRFYAIDFTLDEIKQLNATERFNMKTGEPVYAGRFPVGKSSFEIPTLAEEIELIQGLNKSLGRDVGIYPEIKAPAWHESEGQDIAQATVEVLEQYGYPDDHPKVFLQSFEPEPLRRLHEGGTNLTLIQLIGMNIWRENDVDYDEMVTPEGLRAVAEYADGIGPSIGHIYRGKGDQGRLVYTDLVATARDLGLDVHPYTVRADQLPSGVESVDELHRILLVDQQVEGFFTDFPDLAVAFIQELSEAAGDKASSAGEQ